MIRFTTTTTPRQRRHRRVRARVHGTAERPRVSVFRSGQHVTAQLIDDDTGRTLVAASDRDVQHRSGTTLPHSLPLPKGGGEKEGVGKQGAEQRRAALAREVGKLLAERAKAKGVAKVVFDRGGYAYHGRVKAVAEGAREGGLEF